VWEPSSKTYYIFGSHRASARSTNLMNWYSISVPWKTATSNNAANSAAYTTPAVKTVMKGGKEVDFPAFDAQAWAKRGNSSYNIDGNLWAPDVIYNKTMKKWCMYMSVNGIAGTPALCCSQPTRLQVLISIKALWSSAASVQEPLIRILIWSWQ